MSQPPFPQQPNPQFQQAPGQPTPPQQPVKPKKKWYNRVWVWFLAAIVILVILANVGKGGGETSSGGSAPVAGANASERAAASASAAAEASRKAEASASAAAQASAEAAALKDPSSYKKLSDREFALLVKEPDAHKGEKVILYGYVTQLDSATGPDALRASTASARKSDWYDYSENTIVQAADGGMFADVVKDDLVTIYATVDGSMSYGTQIGGNTTVPKVTAHIIKVTGSAS